MQIALAQLNPTIGDLKGNSEKIVAAAWQAYNQGSTFILFPELFLTGYPPLDLLLLEDFADNSWQALEALVPHLPPVCCVIGLPTKNHSTGKPLHNSAAIIYENKIVSLRHKHLLPTYDVFNETRYFSPGEVGCHQIGNVKMGVLICEDMWAEYPIDGRKLYHNDPIAIFEEQKPHFIAVLNASPFNRGKQGTREQLLKQIAKRCGCLVATVNQVGGQDSLLFDGGSCFVTPEGSITRAISFEEQIVVSDNSTSSPRLSSDAELEAALIMGIKDYFQKLKFRKALLGLSGGIDSSLVAYLTCQALGPENVLGVLLPSRFTSEESCVDALELAKNLGMQTKTISIEEPLEGFLEALEYSPKSIDLPFENLQARTRGVLLMALSNISGALLLSTSNKSELSVGYSTLYGDSCGGLAPIGDLLKTEVYDLCRHINSKGLKIPERVLSKEPTAELRPGQTDQESLPPYSTLDPILNALIVDKRSPQAIATELKLPLDLIEEIYRKIHLSEYKRKQCPPVLRVSPAAFNVGRLVPIVERFNRS